MIFMDPVTPTEMTFGAILLEQNFACDRTLVRAGRSD
jgi:hypothetical protein